MLASSFFKLAPLSPNIQSQITKTIKIEDKVIEFGVNPVLINSKTSIRTGNFEFSFLNNVFPIKFTGLGTITKIDKNKLKQKLEAFIKPTDRKYIKLSEFTHMKSIFTFDIDAYLDDCFKNIKIESFNSSWDRVAKLKIIPPHMVRGFAMRIDIEKYIGTYFKKYIEKHPIMRKDLVKALPKEALKVFNLKEENLFNFIYEYSTNRIIGRLKPEYVAMIIYTITKLKNSKMFGFNRI
ncbi:MAG: hypothetical protein LBF97_07280 [Elusimicrobiota bacterium]|jgi:hypothetical protein|nr:hypothetical protein [Elusimicrobiota bacterium]